MPDGARTPEQARILAALEKVRKREQELSNTPWHERAALRERRGELNDEWLAEERRIARETNAKP
ncbi:MAG TPA: hypothetical protein VGJ91_19995 [Polyangiaceae bacterium]|jgi:hypothetical protein